ncbi:MAG TPA: ATP-binding cassette domain-containing protein [Bryobacteraceae bacterium]|nr:ATP-binding cassette domain-containing protein [Bryobacteraceae bacterium]
MIEARIKKRFEAGRESAGFSLDMAFQAGPGVTALFGPSGSGKTLTLDAIAGFERPDDGRILLDDQILFDGPAQVHLPPRARQCGYVFQNYALFPHMTLRQNLEFAVERVPRLERSRRVTQLLEEFHLAEVAGRRPHQLSGGQKQRCSIARALIGSPRVLLLDEPSRGLDPALRGELHALLAQVRSEYDKPILLVTHDAEECFALADQVLIVIAGKVAQSGVPRVVFEQPASVDVARVLGLYNVLPVEIRALDPGRNSSRLRLGGEADREIAGPYFPGRLIGDRGWLCVRPDRLTAVPRDGRPGKNQVPVVLTRVMTTPWRTRLEFEGDLAVEAPQFDSEALRTCKEWWIEFPQQGLWLI